MAGETAVTHTQPAKPQATSGILSQHLQSNIPPPTGERREITLLSLRITLLPPTADRETSYLFLAKLLQQILPVIREYEGTINSQVSHSFTAIFGLPTLHENDAIRAVQAALVIQNTLEKVRLQTQTKVNLQWAYTIGIHTGNVIVSQGVAGQTTQFTIVGNATDQAEALQNATAPNTIAVSQATYQRTRRNFRYQAGDNQSFHPKKLRQQARFAQGVLGQHTPLIGRLEVLQTLQKIVETAVTDHAVQVILLTGEAGIGKTRLLWTLSEEVSRQQPNITICEGSCLVHTRKRPYWLIAEFLRNLIGISSNESTSAQIAKIQSYLHEIELDKVDVLPHLLRILGLHTANVQSKINDVAILQNLAYAAVRRILTTELERAPVLLILEDLHWADASSCDLLSYLLNSIHGLPLTVLIAARDHYDGCHKKILPANLVNTTAFTELKLAPLNAAEISHFVDKLIPLKTAPIQNLKQQIINRVEGNPFFTEELIRAIVDGGGLVRNDGKWQLTAVAENIVQELPGTLRGLVLARLDTLTPPLRHLLQVASVWGRWFIDEFLAGLAQSSLDVVQNQLKQLVEIQFLIQEPREDGVWYGFNHGLTQDAIYSTLLTGQKRQYHGQAAGLLMTHRDWVVNDYDEFVAYHMLRSAHPEQAIPYLVSAGKRAALDYANETAVYYYRQALKLINPVDNHSHKQFFQARIGLGEALKQLGQNKEAAIILSESLQGILKWSLKTDETTLLPLLVNGLTELADIEQRQSNYDTAVNHLKAGLDAINFPTNNEHKLLQRKVISRLALVQFRQGKLNEAMDLAMDAVANIDVENDPDPVTAASLYNTMGGIAWQQGYLENAIRYVEQALVLNQHIGYNWGIAGNYNNLGILHSQKGDTTSAIRYWENALLIRREQGDLYQLTISLTNLGRMYLGAGNHPAAKANFDESEKLALQIGEKLNYCNTKVGLSVLALHEGDLDTALSHSQEAYALAQQSNSKVNLIRSGWNMAIILADRNELTAAEQKAQESLELAQTTGFLEGEIDAGRVLGIIHIHLGNIVEAETYLKESAELAIQANDLLRQGQALMAQGMVYIQRMQAGEASLYTATIETFTAAESLLIKVGAHYEAAKCQNMLITVETVYQEQQMEQSLVADAPWSASGEKRIATVLWLNLHLPANTDDEALFDTMATILPVFMNIVQEHAGNANQRTNGLTAVFGVPITYEDDAAHAVSAALEMQQFLHNMADTLSVTPTLKIAISQGPVVAGQLDLNRTTGILITGEAHTEAQAIADKIPPASIWVTETIRNKTTYKFAFRPAALTIENLPPLYELAGVSASPGLARGLADRTTRFVGRDDFLQQMLDITNNFTQKIGGIIWVEGEAGIGKSRLMREFQANLPNKNVLIWSGTCSPQRINRAFSVFSDLLSRVFHLELTDTPEKIRERITAVTDQWPRDARITKPYLETLVGLQPSGVEGERLLRLEPEQLRQQTFVAIRRLLKTIAKQQPLILQLDDLHWIDPISAELLIFTATMVTSDPIFFVCAQRREGADIPNDRLLRLQSLLPGQTLHLFLQRLSSGNSHDLIQELLPGINLDRHIETLIINRSEGNPYFIEEYIRMFIEQGHLQQNNGTWVISQALSQNNLDLPASLDVLLRSRIDALPGDMKQVLQAASVIGHDFELALLKKITGKSETPHILQRLESRLMVHNIPDSDGWQFSHRILHEVVYESMLTINQQSLHHKVAKAILSNQQEVSPDKAKEVAHHLKQADKLEEALPFLVMAGEFAAVQFADQEAISYFQLARDILIKQDKADAELAWRTTIGLSEVNLFVGKYEESKAMLESAFDLVQKHTTFQPRMAELHRRMGQVLWKMGNYDSAQTHYTTAHNLLTAQSETLNHLELARVFTGKAWVFFAQGQFDEAEQACLESLPHAEAVDNLNELSTAENLLGGIHFQQSNWRDALHHTTRAMVLREQMGYTWGAAGTLSNLGILAFVAGHWFKAIDFFKRSLERRQDMGDVEGIAITHNNLGHAYRGQGELNLAEHHFQESVKIARTFNIAYRLANSLIGLSLVWVWQGRSTEATAVLAEGKAQAEAIGAKDILAESYQVEAELALANKEWTEAYKHANRAAEAAAELGNRTHVVAGWRIAAAAALMQGNMPEAQSYLEKAMAELEGTVDELETGMLAAQAYHIYCRLGMTEKAESNLRTAKSVYARLGAEWHLQKLEESLAAVTRDNKTT